MAKKYEKVSLITESSPMRSSQRSIPLILPSNLSYDNGTGEVGKTGKAVEGVGFRLVEKALTLLESLPGPVAVVAMIGPYRSGKSYFLSRLLGDEETFRVGHSVQPCTHGVWLATSTLKCEEFSLLVLDTEGAESAIQTDRSSGSMINILFALILHISSMVIYNSKNIPKRSDIKKMSFLSGLSEKIGDNLQPQHLPSLVWLLRDVDLPCKFNGEVVSATEYIHANLGRSQNKEASSNLLQHYPLLQCLTIASNPCPLKGAAYQASNSFERDLKSVTDYILNNVSAKKGYKSDVTLTGHSLALLIRQYFEIVNESPIGIPTLDRSWSAMVEILVEDKLTDLLKGYEQEMNRELEGRLPLDVQCTEKSNKSLISIHDNIFFKKKSILEEFLSQYQCSEMLKDNKIKMFSMRIAQWDTSVQPPKLTGGSLLQFMLSNKKKSECQCNEVYDNVYRECLEDGILEIIISSTARDLTKDLTMLNEKYFQQARGPAKQEVFDLCRSKSRHVEEQLEMLPGPIENLKVVKVTDSTVQLSWSKPTINPSAAKRYEVLIKSRNKAWERCAIVPECNVSVKNLETYTWYCLAVRPVNDQAQCIKVLIVTTRTRHRRITQVATVLGAPISCPAMLGYVGVCHIRNAVKADAKNKIDHGILGGIMLAAVPLGLLVGSIPVLGQLRAALWYIKLTRNINGSGEVTMDAGPLDLIDVPSDDENDSEYPEQEFEDP